MVGFMLLNSRRHQVSLGMVWDFALELLTLHRPSDGAPQPVMVGLFDPSLELAAMRLPVVPKVRR